MEEILKLYQELRGLFPENDLATEFPQRIHQIIQETIDRIPAEARVAIRPAGRDTQKLLELYDFSKKNIIGIVDQKDYGDDFFGYPCFTTDSFPIESCDYVIVSSFCYRQVIKAELEKLHVPYIDVYDELEKKGVRLLFQFHYYEALTQQVVNDFCLRYLWSESGPQRETALHELLQIAVECKDFTLISNIYQDCGGEKGEFPLLKTVWRKSKYLLKRIRDKLQGRKQRDIILFWTDAVPYDMLHYLPGTMELSKQGTFFQRAYTHTPYTNPTLRAIFCNMRPIDDFPQNQEKIYNGNSPLLRFLKDEGYKVRFIGSLGRAMGAEHVIDRGVGLSCNMKWWEGIVDLLQSPEPCFYIFHYLECHVPWIVPDLEEPITPDMITRTNNKVQFKTTLRYLDQCLLFYHKLLGNKTQIFFSDHGVNWGKDPYWIEHRLHPYCFVLGENIPKITVTRFFPYENFEKFVRWLVDPAHHSLDYVCTDEVIFQDTDFYNQELINNLIRGNNAKKGIAYRGVLNYDYKYVVNALGEEFFYQRQQDGTEKLVPLEDSALREELRSKAGTKFLDIYQYDKFRYTRKLYDFIKQNEK